MRKQHGFSLIEVLVSMLVIMIGLLGLAGMQMAAINNTETGRYNSIATDLAANLAAQMQGNSAYWGAPPSSISVSGSTVTGGPSPSSADCFTNNCTAAQMAYFDLSRWGISLASSLPTAVGAIQCSVVTPPATCIVTIAWSEKNIALVNPTGTEQGILASGTSSTHQYQTLVSIQP